MSDPPVPPPGTTWIGEWDADHGDRVYGGESTRIGDVAALLTGLQNRSGSTVSGVALWIEGTTIPDRPRAAILADLTPAQARELAQALTTLADQAERLDRLA